MKKIDDLKKLTTKLLPGIKKISESINELTGTTSVKHLELNDRSDFFLLQELIVSLDKLQWKIESLIKPIVTEGYLYKNSAGRYEIDQYHYFTSGSPVEVLTFDDFHELQIWISTRIEHNGEDYYAVALPNIPLCNLKARVRG